MRRSDALDVAFDIDTGVGSLLPPEGEPVDFAAIEAAVEESGFELLWIEARLRGSLRSATDASGDDQPAVVVAEPRQVFRLSTGTTEQEQRAHDRLLAAADGREPLVLVRGRVDTRDDAPPRLTVRDFRIESAGPADAGR